MTATEIGVIISFVFLLVCGGGVIWHLAWKISRIAQASETHAIQMAQLSLKNETLAHAISDHESFVARTYVSTEAIRDVKTDLVAAVNRLGDRLDNLFLTIAPHQKV